MTEIAAVYQCYFYSGTPVGSILDDELGEGEYQQLLVFVSDIHNSWNFIQNPNTPVDPVPLAPFNQLDGFGPSLEGWIPDVAVNWLLLATNLRKKWAELDKRETPLTYLEVRRVWLRRIAYHLFTDRQRLFPWSLQAELEDAVRDAVRCHFEPANRPALIRLHVVQDFVLAA